MSDVSLPATFVFDGDLDVDAFNDIEPEAKEQGLAVDIETSGLSPIEDTIQVITVATVSRVTIVTISEARRPYYLCTLLSNGSIQKIFHNAVFDTSFLARAWNLDVSPIFCTKVGARIAGVDRNPSLRFLVRELLDEHLDKTEQMSNWSTRPLSQAQQEYAASDVRSLHRLREEISWLISGVGRTALFEAAMKFLPYRAELELLAMPDVFAYELPPLPGEAYRQEEPLR